MKRLLARGPVPVPAERAGAANHAWQGIRYEVGFWATAFATAVQAQLGIAISVYVLVPSSASDSYPYTLLQIQASTVSRKPLSHKLLAGPGYTPDDTHVRNQLRLLDV